MEALCLSFPSGFLALQQGVFCTTWMTSCKGLIDQLINQWSIKIKFFSPIRFRVSILSKKHMVITSVLYFIHRFKLWRCWIKLSCYSYFCRRKPRRWPFKWNIFPAMQFINLYFRKWNFFQTFLTLSRMNSMHKALNKPHHTLKNERVTKPKSKN